jgi:hypothetical protein
MFALRLTRAWPARHCPRRAVVVPTRTFRHSAFLARTAQEALADGLEDIGRNSEDTQDTDTIIKARMTTKKLCTPSKKPLLKNLTTKMPLL